VGAVIIFVHRIAILVVEIVAVNIIHITIAVVVNAVAGDFARVSPDVIGQVGVGIIHAGVNDGDNDFAAAGIKIPGFGGTNIGSRSASRLPGIMQAPEFAEARIIGSGGRDPDHIVGFGVTDAGGGVVGRQYLVHLLASRQCDQVQVGNQSIFLADRGSAQGVQDIRALRRLDFGIKPDQQIGFVVFLTRRELDEGEKKRGPSEAREAPETAGQVEGGLHVGNKAHKAKTAYGCCARRRNTWLLEPIGRVTVFNPLTSTDAGLVTRVHTSGGLRVSALSRL